MCNVYVKIIKSNKKNKITKSNKKNKITKSNKNKKNKPKIKIS